jgi:hypothetical protein
MEYFD